MRCWRESRRKVPTTYLTRGEAAALVAARTMDPHDTVRTARNRVAMQMDRSAANGDDASVGGSARTEDGCVTVDELARWTLRVYPGVFSDLPLKGRNFREKLRDGFAFSESSDPQVLPGSIDACHAQIRAFLAEKKAREAEVIRAHEEYKRELAARFNGKKK